MSEEQLIGEGLAVLQDLAPAGFAIALHVQFTTPTFLFQTYPRAWIEEYSRKGFVLRDPTVIWAFDNLGVIDWAELAARDSDGIMARARDHGLVEGFTYSQETDDSRSLASFARSSDPFAGYEKSRICGIVDDIHRLTAGLGALSPETRDNLRRLSIQFTHPGPNA